MAKSYEYDYSNLRGKIKATYGTETRFSEVLGKSRTFLSNVFNHRAFLDARDIVQMAELLEIPTDQIGMYFFCLKC